MAFGHDGMFYVTSGDGTADSARHTSATGKRASSATAKIRATPKNIRTTKTLKLTGSTFASDFPLVLGPFVQTGVYDLPLVHFEVKSVMTNTAPVGGFISSPGRCVRAAAASPARSCPKKCVTDPALDVGTSQASPMPSPSASPARPARCASCRCSGAP